MAMNRFIFKERSLELRKLENDYGDFILSCRHRDILRCSKTKHFRSCYAPTGVYKELPFALCCDKNIGIIGKKDRSGDFIWRAFVSLTKNWNGEDLLYIFKLYGNWELGTEDKVRLALIVKVREVNFVHWDVR